jgi:small multidrug resistance pump
VGRLTFHALRADRVKFNPNSHQNACSLSADDLSLPSTDLFLWRFLMIYWIYLVIAILTEVVGTTMMKVSQGLTRLVPSVTMFVMYAISFVFMAFALKKLEVSTAYAIWSGLGTAAIAAIGIIWFQESLNAAKVVGTGLVIAGVILLNIKA